MLSQLGDAKTVRACGQAIATSNSADAYMARGLYHYKQGDDTHALSDIDRALTREPNNARFLKNRYVVRSHAGQLDEANNDLRRACALGDTQACHEKQ